MRGPCSSGVQRSRSSVSSICRTRADGATCSCASVAAPITPSTARRVAPLEAPARHRPARPRSAAAAACRGGQVAQRDQPLGQQRAGRRRPARAPACGAPRAGGRQRRQRLAPSRVAGQRAVARQRLAQLLVQRQLRHGGAHRRVRAPPCSAACNCAAASKRPRRETSKSWWMLPRIDAAVVQVGQVALHRQRQRLCQPRAPRRPAGPAARAPRPAAARRRRSRAGPDRARRRRPAAATACCACAPGRPPSNHAGCVRGQRTSGEQTHQPAATRARRQPSCSTSPRMTAALQRQQPCGPAQREQHHQRAELVRGRADELRTRPQAERFEQDRSSRGRPPRRRCR